MTTTAPTETTQLAPAPARAGLDPRTKALLVVATGSTVMAPGGQVFIPAALVLGALLAMTERAWRRVILLPTVAAATATIAYLVPLTLRHPAVGMVAVAAAYALRFVAIAGIALHLIATTSPAQLTVALRAAHLPRAITVAGAVMLRFLPVITAEARAVADAMRLRGIGGWCGMLRHPVLALERFTVPLIASSIRVGEDLSASALLRGLGSRTRPTAMSPSRFTAVDGVCVLVVALLVAVTLFWRAAP